MGVAGGGEESWDVILLIICCLPDLKFVYHPGEILLLRVCVSLHSLRELSGYVLAILTHSCMES